MRVFLTGGAGFIGSHLCDALIAQGDTPVILDNLSTGQLSNIAHIHNKVEIHQGDIRDAALVNKLTEQSDLVLHMAAALGVNTILEKTVESVSTNFTGSEVVLQAALKHKKRIIIASTSEIYGKNPEQPLKETSDRVVGAPQKIRWTYADAKALEEAAARVAPAALPKVPGAKRNPQASAFYGKIGEATRPDREAGAAAQASYAASVAEAAYARSGYAAGSPAYAPGSPAYAPGSPAYNPTSPPYAVGVTPPLAVAKNAKGEFNYNAI